MIEGDRLDVLAHCWVVMTPDGEPHAVRKALERAEHYARNMGDGWRVVEYVRADADRGAVKTERERAIKVVGELLDGGTWPLPAALEALGGLEVARRALGGQEPVPFSPEVPS